MNPSSVPIEPMMRSRTAVDSRAILSPPARPSPVTKTFELTVVMPVYNEQDALAPCVQSWVEVLERAGMSYELLVLDDGSTDPQRRGTGRPRPARARSRDFQGERGPRAHDPRRLPGRSPHLRMGVPGGLRRRDPGGSIHRAVEQPGQQRRRVRRADRQATRRRPQAHLQDGVAHHEDALRHGDPRRQRAVPSDPQRHPGADRRKDPSGHLCTQHRHKRCHRA